MVPCQSNLKSGILIRKQEFARLQLKRTSSHFFSTTNYSHRQDGQMLCGKTRLCSTTGTRTKIIVLHKLVGDALRHSFWGKASQESERGNITDDGSLDLAGSGINATGAMAILNIGSFDTYVRKVYYFFFFSGASIYQFLIRSSLTNLAVQASPTMMILETSIGTLASTSTTLRPPLTC